MLKIGLTGGIGSGKTAVSDLFNELGVPIIDTDLITHDLLKNDASVINKIARCFGAGVVGSDGAIDRKKLAGIVFNDDSCKQQLEAILHPEIRKQVEKQLQHFYSLKPAPPYLIIVIPLLIETNFRELVDRVLVVMSDENRRIERIRQRDQRTATEIKAIIKSQVSDEQRLMAADDILENDSDFMALQSAVRQLHEKYSAPGACLT